MALDERLIPAPVLDMFYIDKDDGLPLAAGTLGFYKDSDNSTLKKIYELTGTAPNYTYTELPNPITLNIAGEVVNGSNQNTLVYLFPYDGTPTSSNNKLELYHVKCLSAGGATQFTRDAIPNITSGSDPVDEAFPVSNQLANPQWSRVFLNASPLTTTYTVAAPATPTEFLLAPDWTLVLSGTGDVVVEREAIAGSTLVPTSPPYALKLVVDPGVTCVLRQRMAANSGLWGSTADQSIYLSGTYVAKITVGSDSVLSIDYLDSNGGSAVQIVSEVVTADSTYQQKKGASVVMPNSANANTGDNAYIDILVNIPANTTTHITSIQVVPTIGASSDILDYDINTSNREQALMGDYFLPALEYKPIPSYLVGWDFPLNPAQFGRTGTITAGTAKYIWDQTISDSFGGNVTYAKASASSELVLTTLSNTTGTYIMQYLAGFQTRLFVDKELSVNVSAYTNAAAGVVTGRIYLFRAPAASSWPTLSTGTSIVDVAASGAVTLTAAAALDGWTKITRSGLGDPEFTVTATSSSDLDIKLNHGFNGWQVTDDAQQADTNKVAIVVSFGVTSSGGEVGILSASLVPGSIPTIPAPQTIMSVYEECRGYWEQSAEAGTTNFATLTNRVAAPMDTNTGTVAQHAMVPIQFRSDKFTPPIFQIYAPSNGTVDNIDAAHGTTGGVITAVNGLTASTFYFLEAAGALSSTTVKTSGTSNTFLLPKGTGQINAAMANAYIYFHYTMDARLGHV